MFISGHFHVLGMRKTRKYISCVLIKKLGRLCTKLHTVAASDNRDHPTRSLCYCLFTSHIYVCCSLHTSHLWWIALSTQHQLRGSNNIPSFLLWTAPITHCFCEGCTWHHLHILVKHHFVVIGMPRRQVCKASHCCNKQQ